MSEWKVHLEFVEGGSSKFWRARADGQTLYVNFGRIGTAGQTQVKDLGSAAAADSELEKLVREKRKKGYADVGSAGSAGADEEEDEGDEDEEEAPPAKKAAPTPAPTPLKLPPRPASAALRLDVPNRQIATKIAVDGVTVRLEADESYGTPEAAQAAYERLRAALLADGHREG